MIVVGRVKGRLKEILLCTDQMRSRCRVAVRGNHVQRGL